MTGRLIRASAKGLAAIARPLGLEVMPGGVYSPAPDLRQLQRETGWRAPRNMAGVAGVSLAEQLAFIDTTMTPDVAGVVAKRDIYAEAAQASGDTGGGFGVVEAELVYAIVRALKPANITFAGSWVALEAARLAAADAGYQPVLTCIDPDPRPYIERLAAEKTIALRVERPQDTPLDVFTRLGAGDVLFIDTAHHVKPGSEVNRLVLDVLPLLAPGVLVHFHGVTFPYDYGRNLLAGEPHAGESALLLAFLSGNAGFRIAASLSMLHHGAPDALKQRFPHYTPQPNSDGLAAGPNGHFPNSLWLKRTG